MHAPLSKVGFFCFHLANEQGTGGNHPNANELLRTLSFETADVNITPFNMLTLKRSVSTGSEGIVNKKRKQNNMEFHPLEETIQTRKKFHAL